MPVLSVSFLLPYDLLRSQVNEGKRNSDDDHYANGLRNQARTRNFALSPVGSDYPLVCCPHFRLSNQGKTQSPSVSQASSYSNPLSILKEVGPRRTACSQPRPRRDLTSLTSPRPTSSFAKPRTFPCSQRKVRLPVDGD